MEPAYVYRAKARRIVDGDTVDMDVDLGFFVSVRIRFRLKGIDTPEIFRQKKESEEYQKGMEAKGFVEDRFRANEDTCMVVSTKTGAYGRWIGEIFFHDSEVSLSQELLDKGFAERYKK